jgi:hypothetical protein
VDGLDLAAVLAVPPPARAALQAANDHVDRSLGLLEWAIVVASLWRGRQVALFASVLWLVVVTSLVIAVVVILAATSVVVAVFVVAT